MLGVDVDASEDDIKAAFRRRAKELHPDVNKEVRTQSQSNTLRCKVQQQLTQEIVLLIQQIIAYQLIHKQGIWLVPESDTRSCQQASLISSS